MDILNIKINDVSLKDSDIYNQVAHWIQFNIANTMDKNEFKAWLLDALNYEILPPADLKKLNDERNKYPRSFEPDFGMIMEFFLHELAQTIGVVEIGKPHNELDFQK